MLSVVESVHWEFGERVDMIAGWIERGEARLAASGCSGLIVCGNYLIRHRYSHSNSYCRYGASLDFAPNANAAVELGPGKFLASELWLAIEVGLQWAGTWRRCFDGGTSLEYRLEVPEFLDGSAQPENLIGWRCIAMNDRERSNHFEGDEHNLLVAHSTQNPGQLRSNKVS